MRIRAESGETVNFQFLSLNLLLTAEAFQCRSTPIEVT